MGAERRGLAQALGAFSIWGLFPLYWPLLEPAGAGEILAHRVAWSLVVVTVLTLVAGRWAAFVAIWRSPRTRASMIGASVVISINWFTYIWAVNNDHVVDAALGYYINPLVTVALGVVIFGDTLRRAQWIALAVTVVAVVVLGVAMGRPPWISLVLAATFGLYGVFKKKAGVGPVEGLTFETSLIAPIAVVYLTVLASGGRAEGLTQGPWHIALLATSGVVTAIPLLLFAAAANNVSLSTIGISQYITPTLQFLCGVLVFHEAMPAARWVGFLLVWVALVVFTLDTVRAFRRGVARMPVEAFEADSVLDPDCLDETR